MAEERDTNGTGTEFPRAFDLVELTEAVEGREPGEHGTVVVEGIDRALVDFAWRDDDASRSVRVGETVSVPHSAMCVVRRSFHEAAFGTEDAVASPGRRD